MADLTGGFGVDFSFLSPLFGKAYYVERQSVLCAAARHNFPLLGLKNAEISSLIDKDKKFVENTMFRITKKYKELINL